jgi:hypothetical protein
VRTSTRIVAFLSLPLVGYAVTHAANSSALKQSYPAKAVLIIEPFGLGGGPDLLARALAPKLSELWCTTCAGPAVAPAPGWFSTVTGRAAFYPRRARWIAARLKSLVHFGRSGPE